MLDLSCMGCRSACSRDNIGQSRLKLNPLMAYDIIRCV